MNGYPLISVAQEQDSHSADKFINEYRAMMKQHVTYKTGIRDMVRLLRDGHYIGLLMDQTRDIRVSWLNSLAAIR